MNYRCELCGVYLDPGERCDCRENKKEDIWNGTEKNKRLVLYTDRINEQIKSYQ